jgi:hypothetical protein
MDIRNKVMHCKVLDAAKGKPIVAQVSTEDVDLAGDVIVQGPNDVGEGWVLDGFNKRGRIYWMHNPLQPSLARANAKVDGGRLLLSVNFDEGDEFAMLLDHKYRAGVLDEWSVGFRPVKGKYVENDHGGLTFYEQTLEEVSAVNQGMNPNTTTISKALAGYMDSAAEIKAVIQSYDDRLRSIEGAIIRMEKAADEQKAKTLLDAYESLKRARATA